MIVTNLDTARGPSAADLKVLERIGQRRRALEAREPAGEHQAAVLRRLFATVDDMEECLCEEGRRAPLLAAGWRQLARLEALYWESTAPARDRRTAEPPRNPAPSTIHKENRKTMITTAIETIRSVADRAAENPPALRRVADSEPARPPAGGPPAASLAGLLPRVAMMLIRLLIARTPEGSTLRIVAQALATFLPLLDLDWLPANPAGIPQPTVRVQAHLDLLRQERASRAHLRGLTARHRPARPAPVQRVQPDRPPASRAATVFGLGDSGDDLWHDLLDLTSETLETFIGYGNQPGIQRCVDLIETLADTFGEPTPAAA